MSLPNYQKITLPAKSGHDLVLELNFNDSAQEDKVVKINGRDIISLKDLYMFMMICGDPEVQAGLMPVQKKQVTMIEKAHNIQLRRDMKKGEFLKIPCLTNVETEVVEGLAGWLTKKREVKKTSSIILPK